MTKPDTSAEGAAAKPLPVFIQPARPQQIDPRLLELEASEQIMVEFAIADTLSGCSNRRAGDYLAEEQERIARQAEGFFTIYEAAQVLADSRPGISPRTMVKQLRQAHDSHKLDIRDHHTRLRRMVNEDVRCFIDLVNVADVDEWLRGQRAGYGFPAHATNTATTRPQAQAADRGRRVKRHALIEHNCRRWETIERDLKEAAVNGLREAASDAEHGWWWESDAQAWARARGKLKDDAAPGLAGLPTTIYRMKR